MITLSNMRNKVKVQKAVVTEDSLGNRTNTYRDYCSRWAYINKKSGSETFAAGKTNEEETLCFVLRHDSLTRLITPGDYRILFNEKTYDITYVDNYKFKNESLTIYAKEIS